MDKGHDIKSSKTNKKSIYSVISVFITLFFLMLNYGSFGLFLGKYSKEFCFIVPFAVAIVIFVMRIIFSKGNDLSSIIYVLALTVCILISCIINNDFGLDNFSLIIVIYTAFFIVSSFSREQLVKCYTVTICGLAVFSLVATYIILPLCISGVLDVFPTYYNSDRPYVDMFFSMSLKYLGTPRNMGFCREPGVYQFFLLIGIYFLIEYGEKSKKNMLSIVLLMATMLTTFSAISYITLPVCVFMLLLKYCTKQNVIKYFLVLSVAIFFAVILLFQIDGINDEIVRTFSKWNEEDGSFKVRMSGIYSNFILFTEKPLLGYGMSNAILQSIERFGYVDVTGTTFIALASYGIAFGIFTNFLLFKSCVCKNIARSCVWGVAIFLSVSSQNLLMSVVVWIFLFLNFAKSETEGGTV